MENNGFERFSKAWKKSGLADSNEKVYTVKEIKKIKMKKSQDFSQTISKSIVFDYVLKSILIAGMLLLAWFYESNSPMIILLVGLIGLTGWLILKEFNIQKKLKRIDDYSRELSEVIKLKLAFYKDQFPPLRIMLAFTNSLLVWVGSMFYLYSKYGYYKMEDLEDLIVTILMVSIAFIGSYLITNWHIKMKVSELEESLENLDDQEAATLQFKLRDKKKKRQKVMMIIFAVIGFALFAFLAITYLIEIW